MVDIESAVKEAQEAAVKASNDMVAKHGADFGACGFAWVQVAPGTSKLAKYLKDKGIGRKHHGERGINVWNPGQNNTQSIDIKEAGAEAFANVLRKHFPELSIYAGSRMD